MKHETVPGKMISIYNNIQMTIIPESTTIQLKQRAWHGDSTLTLSFPKAWKVKVIGQQPLPALADAEIQRALNQPIASPPLSVLAQGKSRAAILIDDLSRPTPTARLLPLICTELFAAGLTPEQITIVIAGGTHAPGSDEDILKKTGSGLPAAVRILIHDCRHTWTAAGTTRHGTPIQVHPAVLESDFKIGVGCIYPHPAAGFSGGAKILVPGAAGYETIRSLHDQRRGAQVRAGSITSDFRQEIEEITAWLGLDFIVNVTLNQDREISAVFAGDHIQAFEQGVGYAKRAYAVEQCPQADIVIADMYPFDADLQVAFDRGLWPVELAPRKASKVLLASCPQGMGGHDLFPVANPFFARLKRRLKTFRLSGLLSLDVRIRAVKKILFHRTLQLLVVSSGLKESDLKKALPKAKLATGWEEALNLLIEKHGDHEPVTVAVYCCAPLMLPCPRKDTPN
jgi:nickel-dependent lactate racemase